MSHMQAIMGDNLPNSYLLIDSKHSTQEGHVKSGTFNAITYCLASRNSRPLKQIYIIVRLSTDVSPVTQRNMMMGEDPKPIQKCKVLMAIKNLIVVAIGKECLLSWKHD